MQTDGIGRKRLFRVRFALFSTAVLAVFLLGVSVLTLQGEAPMPSQSLLAEASAEGNTLLSRIGSDQAVLARVFAPESSELILVEQTSIFAASPASTVNPKTLGLVGIEEEGMTRPEVVRYVVEEGDTAASIAEKFQISLETVLWANNLQRTSALRPGQELLILPVSGALHLVRPYDTLSEIAAWYKADIEKILELNLLDSPEEIFAGDLLIIPDLSLIHI